MNSVIVSGSVMTWPVVKDNDSNRPMMTTFFLESPSRQTNMPMKFLVSALAKPAEKAATLKIGDRVLVSGRLDPNIVDGKTRGLRVLAGDFEKVLEIDKENSQ